MNNLAWGQLFWRRRDSGWYMHPTLGSIHREWGEWFWYPKGRGDIMKRGPYKILDMAIEFAEKEGKK